MTCEFSLDIEYFALQNGNLQLGGRLKHKARCLGAQAVDMWLCPVLAGLPREKYACTSPLFLLPSTTTLSYRRSASATSPEWACRRTQSGAGKGAGIAGHYRRTKLYSLKGMTDEFI